MTTPTAIVRHNGGGDQRWFYGGGTHTWKATADETSGALFAFEELVSEGKATPLHRHPHAGEALYVLEGEIVMLLDDAQHCIETGGFTFVPKGMAHAFVVVSPRARLLTLQTPGTGDVFYRSASEPMNDVGSPGPVDFSRVARAAQESGATELLGAPSFNLS